MPSIYKCIEEFCRTVPQDTLTHFSNNQQRMMFFFCLVVLLYIIEIQYIKRNCNNVCISQGPVQQQSLVSGIIDCCMLVPGAKKLDPKGVYKISDAAKMVTTNDTDFHLGPKQMIQTTQKFNICLY